MSRVLSLFPKTLALLLVLGSVFPLPARAAPSESCSVGFARLAATHALRPESEAHARALLTRILGNEDPVRLEKAYREFERAVKEVRRTRPAHFRVLDAQSDPAWPKDTVEYMFYANQFGKKTANGTFQDAKNLLPYLDDLGVDMVYPLPFLDSPGLDGGFDVKNFFRVDEKFGGNKAFDDFLKEAKKRNMKVKMDLILNHVSDQHEWFQKLLQGDESYRKYFITRDTPPDIVRRYETDAGPVIVYREVDETGKPVEMHRRLIFPDSADSHYREIQLPNGKKLWVYHTFYPFQLDVNYANPEALEEAYKIVGHWANKGIDLFRLDAIPFLFKARENDPRTHAVVELLSLYLRESAPHTRLKVEACQKLECMVEYFGKTAKFNEKGNVPSESQMAYQFKGMNASWLTLLGKDKKYFEEFLGEIAALDLPDNSVWANFLRVHDELSLEMVDDVHKPVIQKALLGEKKRGVPFRDGNGVGGRMANFLENDKDRIRMAFSLLLSQDGMPVLYYGDEIAGQNDLAFMAAEEARRADYLRSRGISARGANDARDAGRGPQSREAFERARKGEGKTLESATFRSVKQMIAARQASLAMRRGETIVAASDRSDVLTYWRAHESEQVLIVNHLSDKKGEVQVDAGRFGGAKFVEFQELLTGKKLRLPVVDGKLRIPLSRYGALWLKAL